MQVNTSAHVPTDQQEASGASIAWALSAIVTHAMLQPSFSSFLNDDVSEHRSFWPFRSSPCTCLVDSVADAWIILRRSCYFSSSQYPKRELATPTDILTRLAIFLLGVLPQAVKIFCMGGIPVTQALTAVFIWSTLMSMIRSVHNKDAMEDFFDLKSQIKTLEFEGFVRLISVTVSRGTNLVLLWYIWLSMGPHLIIEVSEDVFNVLVWMRIILVALTGAYTLHYTASMSSGQKPWIPMIPALFITQPVLPETFISLPNCQNCPNPKFG